MTPRRFLVTGGAGFIGSHLVDRLLALGYSVVALDDLSTGRAQNLAAAERDPMFELVTGSADDRSLVDGLMAQVDVVVHLAAVVGVKRIVERPLESFLINVRTAETVIDASAKYGRRVVVASTSEIYGKNVDVPLAEDDDRVLGSTRLPRWSYSTAKAFEEILACGYANERGLAITTLRFFNTVGPRQSGAYGMVLPSFVSQALANADVTVYGDGTQRRSFCHVLDTVAAIMSVIECPESYGEIYNVGSTVETSIGDLARRVIARSGSDSEVVLVPYNEVYGAGFEDPERRLPDTRKLHSLTGWLPELTLDDAIDGCIAAVGLKRSVVDGPR